MSTNSNIEILNQVFTPSRPVEDQKIFAGRYAQIRSCTNIVKQPGAHAIIYGERGVGKTSIANILRLMLIHVENVDTIKLNCDSTDTYNSLWKKIFQRIIVPYQVFQTTIGFVPGTYSAVETASLSDLCNDYSASNILGILEKLPAPPVIILDEFDRLPAQFDRRLFADTLKNISDNIPKLTIVLVGVGDNVTEIIGEHASIERNLKQVHMPTMTNIELQEILDKGLDQLNLKMDDSVKQLIVEYSCGYPHYTHLLAYHACRIALEREKVTIGEETFDQAVERAIREAQESLRQAYQKATMANKQNIYKEVLLACSIANTDEYGTFQALDLEQPLSKIRKTKTKVNQFTSHLGKFITDERGEILISLGEPRRKRYKFKNPLMRAFVRLNMHSLQKRVVSTAQ